jgi:hypothetical protein
MGNGVHFGHYKPSVQGGVKGDDSWGLLRLRLVGSRTGFRQEIFHHLSHCRLIP